MFDWLMQGSNAKTFLLVLFFVTFVLIVLYVYGRSRKSRLESYKHIPFDEKDGDSADRRATSDEQRH